MASGTSIKVRTPMHQITEALHAVTVHPFEVAS